MQWCVYCVVCNIRLGKGGMDGRIRMRREGEVEGGGGAGIKSELGGEIGEGSGGGEELEGGR